MAMTDANSVDAARPSQRYVSNELTHFVGGAFKGDPDKQYDTLLKILRDAELRSFYKVARVEQSGKTTFFTSEGTSMSVGSSQGSLIEGSLCSGSAVCFCDIPVNDLGIHMSKYSPFGLAFLKPFLVRCGASPAFYVAKNAVDGTNTLGEEFDRIASEVMQLKTDLTYVDKESPVSGKGILLAALFHYVFAFVKAFDSSAPEDSAENTYMEREWRTTANVRFKLADVRRVIIPAEYAKRFRADVPDYYGQITFAEACR